jgi:hypothetical protein
MRKSTAIWWILFGLCMAALPIYYHAFYGLTGPAFEDAAMLMRYAEHLAQGKGIVYNIGEAPVDGATDFLFMVLAAGLHALGLPVEAAVRVLVMLAHLLTVGLVFRTLLVRQLAPGWAALLAALWLALGPALLQAQAGFGAPFFALAASITWLLCQRIKAEGESNRLAIGFAAAALVTGLIRPEGVFLTSFMLGALVLTQGLRQSRRTVLFFAVIMGGLGSLYFLWRWHYFGHPLPNPFYIKGHGILHLSSLKASAMNVVSLAWPYILLSLPSLVSGRFRAERRMIVFHLLPQVAFALLWVLLSNAMNYAMRFQYVLLPLLLLSWHPLNEVAPRNLRLLRPGFLPGAVGTALLIVAGLLLQHRQYAQKGQQFGDGRVTLGRSLADYADKGYRMAVTEAGNLPLYSHWTALDTWGLNDARIAHEGGLNQARLREFSPDLVLFHVSLQEEEPHLPTDPAWERMLDTLRAFVGKGDYEHVASFGSTPWSTHEYYLKPTCPDAQAIRQLIRNTRYVSHETGDTLRPRD